MAGKRRLPVVQEAPEEDAPRAPYQWVGLGATVMLVVWLPLAWVGARTTVALALRAPGESSLATLAAAEGLVAQALALCVAAAAAGYLLGRWGGTIGPREGGAAAALASGSIVALSAATSEFAWSSVVAVPMAAAMGMLGASFGRKRRS